MPMTDILMTTVLGTVLLALAVDVALRRGAVRGDRRVQCVARRRSSARSCRGGETMSNFDEEQKAASAKAKADIETLIAAITSTSVKTAVHALFTDILNYGSVCSAQRLHTLEQNMSALADYITQEGYVDEIQKYRQRAFDSQHPCRCPVCEQYDARTQGNVHTIQ
jgi:hypothetical protein